jgi:hypothetical protein
MAELVQAFEQRVGGLSIEKNGFGFIDLTVADGRRPIFPVAFTVFKEPGTDTVISMGRLWPVLEIE